MLDLYVYYKVQEAHCATLAPQVRAMQQQLARATGTVGALKRRPEAANGCQTWMEVYLGVDSGFAELLASAAGQAGVARFIDGARHVEVFTDLPPCA